MPISLRTRPTCHYCGKRNGPSHNHSKFTCQYCQADNYLDESGQIIDVPASATTTPKQYAIPATPIFDAPEGSIFCSTCLKNQYMYNAALAEYLPDPEHEDYDRMEASIPAFKKDLERRFPTCCVRCESKVKAQIQQATYNARSDHLRRVLDRSRQRRMASTWGWRSLVINAAGLGWLTSLLVQLLWHGFGSQARDEVWEPNLNIVKCVSRWPVSKGCPAMLEEYIGPCFMLGLLCIWWNPKWQHKLEGREGRLVGLDKFYKVQGVLLALRFLLWTMIEDVSSFTNFKPMLHTVSLVLITMVAGWSCFSIIKVYTPRIVDWSQDPAPLLDSKQYVPPAPMQQVSPPNSQEVVPVNIFNTAISGGPQAWRPPTPPIDEDAMEWDPTPVAFSPNLKKINYKSTEPTPFQGTLPALPKGSVYQSRTSKAVEQPKAIGLPIGFFDKSHGKSIDSRSTNQSTGAEIAQPKFFPNMEKADTGLENIFDRVFSLHDYASSPRKASGTSSEVLQGANQETRSTSDRFEYDQVPISIENQYRFCVAFTLAMSAIGLLFRPEWTPTVLKFLIPIPLLDILVHIFTSFVMKSTSLSITKIVVMVIDVFALLGIGRLQPENHVSPLWNKIVIASLFFLVANEIYPFCTGEVRTFPKNESTTIHQENQQAIPPPSPAPRNQNTHTGFQKVRRSSSDESIASTASIATTSTASGWKTPVRNHREELKHAASSTPYGPSYGFGGLSLKNDHNFGSSNSVSGPRTGRAPATRNQRGW